MQQVELLTQKERRLVETTSEGGFVSQFVEWASMKTDASVYALEAAGLQALSLAAGDVVVLPSFFGDKPIYMNLYIMLVGPSTTMRKTTVLGYIEGLLPVNEINGHPFVRVLDDVSIQAFNRELAEAGAAQAPLLLSVDEVAGKAEDAVQPLGAAIEHGRQQGHDVEGHQVHGHHGSSRAIESVLEILGHGIDSGPKKLG